MENKSTDCCEEDEDEELGAFIYRISRAAKKNEGVNNGEATTAKEKVHQSSTVSISAKTRKIIPEIGYDINDADDPPKKKRRTSMMIAVAAEKGAVEATNTKIKRRTQPARAAAVAAKAKIAEFEDIMTDDEQSYKKSTTMLTQTNCSHKRRSKHLKESKSNTSPSVINKTCTYHRGCTKSAVKSYEGLCRKHYKEKGGGIIDVSNDTKSNNFNKEETVFCNYGGCTRLAKYDGSMCQHHQHHQRWDDTWNKNFEELCSYKKKHGHVNVPSSKGSLGYWVANQRKQYRHKCQGRKSSMADEREKALNDLGFVWVRGFVGHNRDSSKFDEKWSSRFEELRAFKKTHGRAAVPVTRGSLGRWCSHQRRGYRAWIQGKVRRDAYMTDERANALNELGFVWAPSREDTAPFRDRRSQDEKWNRYLEELRSYKKKHGHINVPAKTSSLGSWTCKQRTYYQAKLRGQKMRGLSAFTDERVKALNELGFDWESQNGRPRSGKKKTV